VTPPFQDALRRAFESSGGRPLAQVATVSPAGLPEVRTVVLRGLGQDGDPWFASDARSEKFRSLAVTPWLELCLFEARAGVQWRLLGRAAVHAGDGLARRAWGELPPDTRALFSSPPPGRPLAESQGEGGERRRPTATPPGNFAVVRLPPERCDKLVLGPPLQRRIWRLAAGQWAQRDIVP